VFGPLRNFVENPPQNELRYQKDDARNDADIGSSATANRRHSIGSRQTQTSHQHGPRTKKNSEIWYQGIGRKGPCDCRGAVLIGIVHARFGAPRLLVALKKRRHALKNARHVLKIADKSAHSKKNHFANGFTRSIDSLKSVSPGARLAPF